MVRYYGLRSVACRSSKWDSEMKKLLLTSVLAIAAVVTTADVPILPHRILVEVTADYPSRPGPMICSIIKCWVYELSW
jgi:hypothetical protein